LNNNSHVIKDEASEYIFIPYLKAIAVVLVINSHLSAFYPNPMYATGGALGNALFFAISGFCLVRIKSPFIKWYERRISRIYPQTIILAIIMLFINDMSKGFIGLTLRELLLVIWPTRYWFVGALALFYIPYYFFVKFYSKKVFLVSTLVLFILYIVFYLKMDTKFWIVESSDVTSITSYFRFIYYFFIFQLGAHFRLGIFPNVIKGTYINLALSIICVGFLYLTKYLMDKMIWSMHLQFVNQICVILFIVFILKFCYFKENNSKVQNNIITDKLYLIASFVSERSLEFYLTHSILIRFVYYILFPFNVIVLILSVLFFTECMHYAIQKYQKYVYRST
jgi:hypothetical protein